MRKNRKIRALRICDNTTIPALSDMASALNGMVKESRELSAEFHQLRLRMEEHFRQHNQKVFWLLNKIRFRMDRLEKKLEI
jgi:hypothetical protein